MNNNLQTLFELPKDHEAVIKFEDGTEEKCTLTFLKVEREIQKLFSYSTGSYCLLKGKYLFYGSFTFNKPEIDLIGRASIDFDLILDNGTLVKGCCLIGSRESLYSLHLYNFVARSFDWKEYYERESFVEPINYEI